MPAPGEQHLNSGGKTITNPFEEVKPRISEYTAQEIATLQSRLEKQLGPEYISSRAGPGGQKVYYLAAEKCIQLANEVFGFNGWSSQIMDVQVDFVDENPQTMKVSLGLSVIVRVTLRDGTFHEDVGYGHMENAKGKAAAFEKAKKEGTTDGLKRALRNFGNVLGNCIYDKEYLGKVTKVKAPPSKWDVARLHRHSDFTPAKKEPEVPKPIEEKSKNLTGAIGASLTNLASEDTFDEEFGGWSFSSPILDFDEADFGVADPDAHPDEVVLPPQSASTSSRHFNSAPNTNPAIPQNQLQNRSPVKQLQPMAAPTGRPLNPTPPNPQTPNSGFSRSTSGANSAMHPPGGLLQNAQAAHAQAPPVATRRVLDQPSRALDQPSRVLDQPNRAPNFNQPSRTGTGPPSAPTSPKRLTSSADDLPPEGLGFCSARGAATEADSPAVTKNPFNPHAESPSIRRTPGVDRKTSKPLTRDLKHVALPGPSSSQSPVPAAGGGFRNPANALDGVRKIGAPGGNNPSPMGNRGSYKPPTLLKRPVDASAGRPPLTDLGANGAISGAGAEAGGDVKRQRMNG
ncbi:DNA repair and recombination protein [Lachnellula occidentalis]|uniref:RAD52 homolog n=1 Tax=Lachnellula occidentalis TaxID=215460 RepID=A0A8H8UEU3_9HELO|nr:DNA repair and recombination protein [Lachnellula occidentalis]